jgi:hypothetical protein
MNWKGLTGSGGPKRSKTSVKAQNQYLSNSLCFGTNASTPVDKYALNVVFNDVQKNVIWMLS